MWLKAHEICRFR